MIPRKGLASDEVYRQLTKPNASTSHWTPMSAIVTLVMFGSVPVKLMYLTCQGNFSLSALCFPPVQLGSSNIARVTAPISWPDTFVTVSEWKLPSSVTLHLIVAPAKPSSLKVMDAQMARQCELLVASRVAEAFPTAAAKTIAATRDANGIR
jgi:hypothetical protein